MQVRQQLQLHNTILKYVNLVIYNHSKTLLLTALYFIQTVLYVHLKITFTFLVLRLKLNHIMYVLIL